MSYRIELKQEFDLYPFLVEAYDSGSHGLNHLYEVYDFAMNLNEIYDLNENEILYSVLFHDMFQKEDRENHHQLAHDWLMKTDLIPFDDLGMDRERVALATLEHRASYKGSYSTRLSELITTADKGIPNINDIVLRSFLYSKERNPKADDQELIQMVISHLVKKYGKNGYLKYNNIVAKMYKFRIDELHTIVDEIEKGRIKIQICELEDIIIDQIPINFQFSPLKGYHCTQEFLEEEFKASGIQQPTWVFEPTIKIVKIASKFFNEAPTFSVYSNFFNKDNYEN